MTFQKLIGRQYAADVIPTRSHGAAWNSRPFAFKVRACSYTMGRPEQGSKTALPPLMSTTTHDEVGSTLGSRTPAA